MGHRTQVHRVATVLVGAAHVAHHDWPDVETDQTLQRIVANVEGLLHELRTGNPPKADEHLHTLDDLLVTLPQERKDGAEPTAGAGDPRFSIGLLIDVDLVLEKHGYGRSNGGQMVELQQHLFHLLHGDPARDCTGGARTSPKASGHERHHRQPVGPR